MANEFVKSHDLVNNLHMQEIQSMTSCKWSCLHMQDTFLLEPGHVNHKLFDAHARSLWRCQSIDKKELLTSHNMFKARLNGTSKKNKETSHSSRASKCLCIGSSLLQTKVKETGHCTLIPYGSSCFTLLASVAFTDYEFASNIFHAIIQNTATN